MLRSFIILYRCTKKGNQIINSFQFQELDDLDMSI